ncbi:MAG: tetratricopeptide repeat protein [Deltaproteobacteria bacterium]|nr:tetratricopeptide repeat protein [Deltaproteobacteria bacterium]
MRVGQHHEPTHSASRGSVGSVVSPTARAPRATIASLACLLSAALSGCFLWTSADQGSALERRAAQCEERLTTLESTASGYTTQMESAHAKVAELESVLERATTLVTQNSADTGARVDAFEQTLMTQAGQIDEVRHELTRLQEEFNEQQRDYEGRMKQLARRAGVDMPVDEAQIPAAADDHFRAAGVAYEARDFSTARALYRAFVTRHATDARADDAQFRVGQSYLQEDRPATALGELRRIIADFGTGDQVPAALLAMGEAFYRLHECDSARTALETLQRAHPRSPQATEARTRLRDLQRAPAGYCQAR